MSSNQNIFEEIFCLTERSRLLKGQELQKKWFKSADKRIIGQFLQKFIEYNSKSFNFLDVKPFIFGSDQNTALSFQTGDYIGAIPLRASDTGKQIGDLIVIPRFSGRDKFEDYIEILNMLGDDICPETMDTIPLASGRNFRPPLYLEALRFIASLEEVLKTPWRKFDSIQTIRNQPQGQINWNKYIVNEYKVENKLNFPVTHSFLSEEHREYAQLRYVFDLCTQELLSANTPIRIKSTIRPRLDYLTQKLYQHKPLFTTHVQIKSFDSLRVKACKFSANAILTYHLSQSTAWRVNYSDVFEKYVQHAFRSVSKEMGGMLLANHRINARSEKYYSWELKHLEPDAMFIKNNTTVFIDAKYKSNLYNKWDISELLKSDHRHDLHQVLAYSSFSNSNNKHGILCYPSKKVEQKKISFKNPINEVVNTVTICGIPLVKSQFLETKKMLAQELELMTAN